MVGWWETLRERVRVCVYYIYIYIYIYIYMLSTHIRTHNIYLLTNRCNLKYEYNNALSPNIKETLIQKKTHIKKH